MPTEIAEPDAAMLQVDVTQSCRSANSSGIQVVTRKLYRALTGRVQVEPLAWDPLLKHYARLSPSEIERMENPFPANYRPTERPNKKDNPPWKTFSRSIFRLSRRIKWKDLGSPGKAMLFPEVFRDTRVKALPNRLPTTLTTAAVFHDACVLRDPENTPLGRVRNFREYATFAASCDLVICISQETKEDLEKLILPEVETPGHIVVNGWPMERPATKPETPPTGDEPPLIICVSTLGYQKNHHCLLEAAERLWKEGFGFRLELIGKADPTWSPRVIARIDELKASGHNLSWLRHVDDNVLANRYGQASFTVFPSRYEGFGLPILESIAHGKPCVCGSNGAIGEVSSGGGCLNVDQNDPHSLAMGMRRLLENENLLGRLRKEALDRDLGSWDDYAKRFLDRLEEISPD